MRQTKIHQDYQTHPPQHPVLRSTLIFFLFGILPLCIIMFYVATRTAAKQGPAFPPTCASENMPQIASAAIDHKTNTITIQCGRANTPY